MGKYTQQRRRGTHVPPAAALLAPVLSLVGGDTLTWVWAHADPNNWNQETGPSADGPWSLDTQLSGVARTEDAYSDGNWHTIIGVDDDGNPITGRSNAVFA